MICLKRLTRSILPHSIFVALLLVCSAELVTGQEQERLAPALADQAYQELSLKNYPAAIANFTKALEKDPSNSRWRKDLGYAYLALGSPMYAEKEFVIVYSDNHNELSIGLQLGYISEQLHKYDAAEKYFNEAAASADDNISNPARAALTNLRVTRLRVHKQQAYDLLLQNRRNEAIKIFEQVHEADPADADTTLQLGYMHFAARDNRKARALFMSARGNPNHDVAARADAALAEINRESKPWFGSIYAAPAYQSRFSNQINALNIKIGLRPTAYFEPYVGLRAVRDVRSKTGQLPQIYSDNTAIVAFGIQSQFTRIGATFYGEAGTAQSLLRHSSQIRRMPDYRAGMSWYKGWGKSLSAMAQENSSGFSLTGSGYMDAGYYTRYNHNVIGYAQLRQGVNLPGSRFLQVQILAAANFVKDANKDFYNNVAEGGPVLRISPFYHVLGIQLEGQYMHGYYTQRDPANPYPANYRDYRLLGTWSANF